jgi:hypothetical protein
MMVALASVLGFAAFVFSLARWHRAGAHFHPLLQFQLMGLNGAFLTGDLFTVMPRRSRRAAGRPGGRPPARTGSRNARRRP